MTSVGERQVASLAAAASEDSPFALGLLLREAHDYVATSIDDALRPFGIERRHLMVMMRLIIDGPTSQRDLVERTQHDKASMVRIVDDLERLGIASRELIPGDRRLRAVTLSERGQEIYADASRSAQPAAQAATSRLTGKQTEQLERLLRTLLGH